MRDFLASTELFGFLDDAGLERLIGELDTHWLPGGRLLFQEGEIGDCLYIVAHGRLKVMVDGDGDREEQVVGEVGRGETVGEMALITGDARSATVVAVRDTMLYKLSQESFNRLVEQNPQMTMLLARRIVARAQRPPVTGSPALRGTPYSIAIVAAGQESPIGEFARRLERALGPAGPVQRLHSDKVDGALGAGASQIAQDHSRNQEILGWLNAQEERHLFVLYEADLVPDAWTARCIRQADLILLVANAKGSPALGPIEGMLRRDRSSAAGVDTDLVLLQAERRPLYPNTREWLAPRVVRRHHHLVLDSDEDFGRLTRILTGRATGVVLGGGGARGFAHIGVLRAIDEAGIPVDLVGGTSMGAMIAAQRALGWDSKAILDYNRDLWNRRKPLRDYTLPLLGLISGKKFRSIAKKTYGDAMVEDLAIPFFCISSNLTRASAVVHREGLLWRWVGASAAVPGIAPPLFHEGQLLVDGGVLDNLPILAMRRICDGSVIASDVTPREDLAVDPSLNWSPSTWRLLRARFTPFARHRLPTLFDVLARVSSLQGISNVERIKEQADLYLHPPVEAFSMFDWKKIDELADIGYRFAMAALETWKSGGQQLRTSQPRRRVPTREHRASPVGIEARTQG